MAIIIGVLIAIQGTQLSMLPPAFTAVLAILSKVSSAALLLPVSEAIGQLKWSWLQKNSRNMWDFEIFDYASRGPWGSLLLLILTKGKALAAFGAVITLFSLALDPFFQQLVDFPERWTLSGFSQVPRVVRYTPRYALELQAGLAIASRDQALQVVSESYFFDNGTQPMPFGNGTRADIPLSCPTGNCTWSTYETLGICSQCVEMKELLTYGCRNTTFDWTSDVAIYRANLTSGMACGYFLNITGPDPILMSGYAVDPKNNTRGEALVSRIFPFVSNPKRVQYFGGSINFRHIRDPIVDALIVGASNGSHSVYQDEVPIVHECVISWCVKSIKSTYYLATYEEEVTETFFNTTEGPNPWTTHFVTELGVVGMSTSYDEDIQIEAPKDGVISLEYGMTNDTAVTTIFNFDDIFPSFVTVKDPSADPFIRYKVHKLGPFLRKIKNNPWAAPYNVTQHMERFATALTNAVRSSDSIEMISGQAFTSATFVEVRWPWLALPLGLLGLTSIFLTATIVKTSNERDQVGPWKTSALATLLWGPPDDYQERIGSGGTPREKEKPKVVAT